MASNQLPQAAKTQLKEKLDVLFGRVLTGFPCPLDFHQRQELVRCNNSDEDVCRIKAVQHLGVLNEVRRVIMFIPCANRDIQIRIFAWDSPTNDTAFRGCTNRAFPVGAALANMVAHRLGRGAYDQFARWVRNAVGLSEDINMALETFDEIMKFTRTAGHLRRMVPELYRLAGLPQITSSRSSAVPYDWSSYPRQRVEWLTATIAKCQLLPESIDKWSERSKYTWPVVNNDEN